MSDLPFIARSLWNHDHRDFTGKIPAEQAFVSACIVLNDVRNLFGAC
ncbi:TPA: hypothetical protein ACSTJ0_004020 [Serratia fonticola]